MTATALHPSKTKLLDAALRVIRTKGYCAAHIDDVCEAAGVTKGSFFHHFAGKEDMALAAAAYWSAITAEVFEHGPYHQLQDPLDRVLGYIDFRKELLDGTVPEFTCLLGTMVQETYLTDPAIRDACERGISDHAATLEADIDAAIASLGIAADWTAESLALHTQAVLQGAFILAKAKGGPDVAVACVEHLRRYIELVFNKDHTGGNR